MPAPRRYTSWPWWSLLLTAVVLINPIGIEFIRNALSGDPWSRAIAGPILVAVLAGLGLLVPIEYGVRQALIRRSAAKAAHEAASE